MSKMMLKGYENNPSAKQIRNLLLVLGSAVLCGCLLIVGMIRYWGPDGSYALHDVLLAPEVFSKLAYNNTDANTLGSGRLIFDRVEFTFFDKVSRQWRSVPVSLEQYEAFYALIRNDRSIVKTNAARFDQTSSSRLIIWAKASIPGSADRSIFQQVNFSGEGGLYRVELRGQKNDWVYFEHPTIYHAAMALFVSQSRVSSS